MLKGYNAKRVDWTDGMLAVFTSCNKNYWLLCQSLVVLAVADDATLSQFITLILFTNWCYAQKCLGEK